MKLIIFTFLLSLTNIHCLSIPINDSLTLEATISEQFDDSTIVYKNLIIQLDSKIIFIVSSNKEFHVNNTPMTIQTGGGNLLIFLEYCDRPLKEKHFVLTLTGDSITETKLLPYFENEFINHDKDLNLETYSFEDYNEAYCTNCDSSYYNPILFYEVQESSIEIDSILTVATYNTAKIPFHGFSQSEKIVPTIEQESIFHHIEKK